MLLAISGVNEALKITIFKLLGKNGVIYQPPVRITKYHETETSKRVILPQVQLPIIDNCYPEIKKPSRVAL